MTQHAPNDRLDRLGGTGFRQMSLQRVSGNQDIDPCLSVVMPVYNEVRTIQQIISHVLSQQPVQELIIVDDRSADGTWDVLQACAARDDRIKLHRHEQNRGKGAALRTGFSHATSDYVIIQDADLEYDPAEYYLMLMPLLSNKADVVFGTRFAGGTHRVLYYWHSVGNKVLTTFSNMVTNLGLTDMETCYKVFRRQALQRIQLKEDRFGFEPEITAKVARMGLRVYEVPISYYGRTYAEGKKITFRDGFRALYCITKYGIFRR
jgi:glycosyltransferase involved in cell wall biosynthesis